MPILKRAIFIKDCSASIYESHLESESADCFYQYHQLDVNMYIYGKKMRKLVDTYFQASRLTRGLCYMEFFTYTFRAEGAANFRPCRVRICLRTCRRDFINCSAHTAHSFGHVIPRCSPPIFANVTINYSMRKHIDQYVRITNSEK